MIINANIKSINKEEVYKKVFDEESFLDWEYVYKNNPPGERNFIGGVNECITLAEYLTFPGIEGHFKEQALLNVPVMILRVLEDLRQSGLGFATVPRDADSMPVSNPAAANTQQEPWVSSTNMLCMFLLHNMEGLVGSTVLENHASRVLQRPVREEVLSFLAKCSDYRYAESEYGGAIAWVLRLVKPSDDFTAQLNTYLAQRETVAMAMKAKIIQVSSGRPRLLDKVKQIRNMSSVTTDTGVVLTGTAIDTFDGWCTRVRFPNTVSLRLKKRLYLCMSMSHVNHRSLIPSYIQKGMADDVLKQVISMPDETVLADTISRMNIQMAPFAELLDFQKEVFRAIPQKAVSEISILTAMHLYLCAYQRPEIWRKCWTYIYPLLSTQVVKDVEDFVAKRKFNEAKFLLLLKTN
jgi:hypothetical protein